MTGKEIFNLQRKDSQEPVSEEIIYDEVGKKYICKIQSCYNDKIEMYFTGTFAERYVKTAQVIWLAIITDYQILPNNLIYLPPSIYWTIYKRLEHGKEIIKGKGAMYLNGRRCYFPQPNYYFTPQDSYDKGVYGIYDGDTLLYIGSSSNIQERWKEHDQSFRNKSGNNMMYKLIKTDPDLLDYQVLVSESDMQELLGAETPSMWIYELIEYTYIKALNPEYNTEGRTKPFAFKAQLGDIPIDCWAIAQSFIEDQPGGLYRTMKILPDVPPAEVQGKIKEYEEYLYKNIAPLDLRNKEDE